jgi:hypothetical protein
MCRGREGLGAAWQASRCRESEGFSTGVLSRKSCSMSGVVEEARCGEPVNLIYRRASLIQED